MLKPVKWLLFLCLAFGLPAHRPADAQTLDTINQSKTIRLGYIADEKPFSFKTTDGSPAGYAIDLCRRIADEVGRSVPGLKKGYVETTLSDGFNAVKDGRSIFFAVRPRSILPGAKASISPNPSS